MEIHEPRYAKAPDGGYIAYAVLGEGPVDLAFVSWSPGNIEIMFECEEANRFWMALASFARVIVHDRRGTGLSDDMGGLPNLETRAADLLAVLDSASSERPTIFGFHEGGMVGALLASTHPARVSSLCWYSPFAYTPADRWATLGEAPQLDALAHRWEAEWGTEEFARSMFMGADMPPEIVRWAAKMQRQGCGPATAGMLLRLVARSDVRAILPSVHAPALLLFPENVSDEQDRRDAEEVARLLPNSTLRVVGGRGIYYLDPESHLDLIRRFLGVEPPAPVLNRVLSTLLFTDIVGSTQRATTMGDAAWRELLATHDAIVREVIARYRGREVKTTGDGFLATFDGPARAVFAAREATGAVRDRCGLGIRTGVHTAEIELRGDDVAGVAVHAAARIMSLAGPSEVWTSATVKDLTAGSGLVFEDVGEHELKGVPDRWHLYRVVSGPT